MVNFGLLTAEICSRVWGHPCKFQWVSLLGSVTAWHSSSGRQPNFAALNRGRHLYLAGWPSRWALAHILVVLVFFITIFCLVPCGRLSWFCQLLGSHKYSASYRIVSYCTDCCRLLALLVLLMMMMMM